MMAALAKLVRPEDLADAWQVGKTSVYDLLKRKTDPLPGYKLGASWRIDPVEAEAWRQAQKNGAAA